MPRRKEKKHGRLMKTIIDFGQSTSFHGVKYAVSPESRLFEKIFWICVVCAGFSGAIYMTLIFWERYNSNPIRITIQSVHKQTSIIPFPGVTICTTIRQDPVKVEKFIKKLILPTDVKIEDIENAMPLLIGFSRPIQANSTDLNMLDRVFRLNNYTSAKTVFQEIQPACENILIKCKLENYVLPCEKIFRTAFTKDGHCCTFNSKAGANKNFKKYRTLFYGYQMGLSVILDPIATNVARAVSTLNSAGIKVLIHSPVDYPGISSTEKIIGNGTESYIRILGTKLISSESVKSLTATQRKCLFENEKHLEYFQYYRDTNCGTECIISKIYRYCNCIPYTFPQKGKPICNISSIACLAENYNNIYRSPTKISRLSKDSINMSLNAIQCDCPPQCNDVFYDVQSSSIPLSNVNSTITNFYNIETQDISKKMVIHVYFANHYQTEMLRDTITSTYYLLSSFGGVFSLFLGCSFLSILEIIYFFCIRIFTKYN